MMTYSELGRERANPYARIDNNLKLDDCPCTDAVVCLDTLTSATIATTEVITQVVFDGVTFLPADPVMSLGGEQIMAAPGTITAADTAELQAWLEAICKTKEFDVSVTVTHVTTTLTVTHVGAKELTSITTDAPETISTDRCCLLYDVFTNTLSLPAGAAAAITVDGATSALDTGTYADGAATAQLVTDIKAELDALSIPWSSVTATFDVGDDEHDIIIISTGRDIAIDLLLFTNTASSEAFICPAQ